MNIHLLKTEKKGNQNIKYMIAKNDVKISTKNADRNYPLYTLSRELEFTKGHLKRIKRTRKTQPSFYTQDVEEVMQYRIDDLRKAIKKLKK